MQIAMAEEIFDIRMSQANPLKQIMNQLAHSVSAVGPLILLPNISGLQQLIYPQLRKWKRGMELKGLRVNIGKTKVMRCQVRIDQAEESGKYPCGVYRQGVGDNSIKCVACHK